MRKPPVKSAEQRIKILFLPRGSIVLSNRKVKAQTIVGTEHNNWNVRVKNPISGSEKVNGGRNNPPTDEPKKLAYITRPTTNRKDKMLTHTTER